VLLFLEEKGMPVVERTQIQQLSIKKEDSYLHTADSSAAVLAGMSLVTRVNELIARAIDMFKLGRNRQDR
jgi:hypothetical protein